MMRRRQFLRAAGAAAATAPLVLRGATADEFKIGLVADAQFADVAAKGTRFYRQSIGKLGTAVEHFNGRKLDFCVHLGDLIDREWSSFDEILQPLAASRHRFHHLLGNHDFEVLAEYKARVPGRMGMEARYSFFDHRGFRFVILDTNDVSTYAHVPGTPEHEAAVVELARLQAARQPQAKTWNGALGAAQLAWLDRICGEAAARRLRVILLAHHPVLPVAGDTLWNPQDALALIGRHRHVVAWFNGHNHAGAYAEHDQVHFVTLRGMVETENTNAFATAHIRSDRLIITGHGREPSRELVFRS